MNSTRFLLATTWPFVVALLAMFCIMDPFFYVPLVKGLLLAAVILAPLVYYHWRDLRTREAQSLIPKE